MILGNAFKILQKQITGHKEVKAKGCQRHCYDWYGVTQHLEDTLGILDRSTTPADDITALQNEQLVYMHDENCRGCLRRGDLLKDYFNHTGALAGQEDLRCDEDLFWG